MFLFLVVSVCVVVLCMFRFVVGVFDLYVLFVCLLCCLERVCVGCFVLLRCCWFPFLCIARYNHVSLETEQFNNHALRMRASSV